MNELIHLTANGWKQVPPDKNKEAVCKMVKSCYEFTNSKGTVVYFMLCNDESLYMVKLQHSRGGNPYFFQFKTLDEEGAAISINRLKEEADINNYFNFYFTLQKDFEEVSITAWEQWESDYR